MGIIEEVHQFISKESTPALLKETRSLKNIYGGACSQEVCEEVCRQWMAGAELAQRIRGPWRIRDVYLFNSK